MTARRSATTFVGVDREAYEQLMKELSALPSEVREFDGVWVTMHTTMRNLLLESHTRLIVTDLVPNPDISQSTFDLGRLESH